MLPNGDLTTLPTSIQFKSDLNFVVEKCSQDTFALDPECQEEWTETTYKLVIIATLTNQDVVAPLVQDASVAFDVTIYNDCATDTI